MALVWVVPREVKSNVEMNHSNTITITKTKTKLTVSIERRKNEEDVA